MSAVRLTGRSAASPRSPRWSRPRAPLSALRRPRPYSHVQDFGGLVDSGGEAALALRRQQQLMQRLPSALHPADESRAVRVDGGGCSGSAVPGTHPRRSGPTPRAPKTAARPAAASPGSGPPAPRGARRLARPTWRCFPEQRPGRGFPLES